MQRIDAVVSSSFGSENVSYSLMQRLEGRRLFAVTATDEALVVDGTSGDDEIVVKMDADGERVRITINGADQGAFEAGEEGVWEVLVNGLAGNDAITVDETDADFEYAVDMRGGKGNDTLTGGSNSDFLMGMSGNDVLNSGGSPDGDFGDFLFGNVGDDTLTGGANVDRFFGGLGSDALVNVEAEDVLQSNDGDTVDGEAYNRVTINGTADEDEILVTVDGEDVVISINGVDNAPLSNSRALELLVLGGADNDTIEIQDSSGNPLLFNEIRLRGGDGNDTITGGQTRALIHGEAGSDVLTGSVVADRIFGGDGADEINGLGGQDHLEGNSGNDEINGGDAKDEIFGGKGDDVISAGEGNDVARGGSGADTLSGNAGNDGLFGGHGEDELNGGAGNDTLKGAYDADDLFGGDGDDLLIGRLDKGLNDPDDHLDGGAGDDTLKGIEGGDVIE